MANQIQLNAWDLTIFIVYMFLAVGLGFLVSLGRKKTTRGYFLGGKSLPWYVIGASMLASDVSSEHFIANTGIGYKYGIVAATSGAMRRKQTSASPIISNWRSTAALSISSAR